MKVTGLVIRVDDFDTEAMQNERTDEMVRILQGLLNQIAEYGVPNADGMRLKDSDGEDVGIVSVHFTEEDV